MPDRAAFPALDGRDNPLIHEIALTELTAPALLFEVER
jgi:hypothetical protein